VEVIGARTTDKFVIYWAGTLPALASFPTRRSSDLRLFKTTDPTKWLVFTVSAVASPSGYKNVTVANVDGSSASPFSNGDAITMKFGRAHVCTPITTTAAIRSSGGTGATGTQGDGGA